MNLIRSMLWTTIFSAAFPLLSPALREVSASPSRPCAFYSSSDFTLPSTRENAFLTRVSPHGAFNYRLLGNPRGRLVVLVPGFPDARYFDALTALLIARGHHVLLLDLPGKSGYRWNTKVSVDTFFAEFDSLWTELGMNTQKRVTILGTSASGALAARMALGWRTQDPELVLISALGMPRDWPLAVQLGTSPRVSNLLAPLFLARQVSSNWRKREILCAQNFPVLFERQKVEFKHPGAERHYARMVREFAVGDQTALYNQVGSAQIRTVLMYGDHDPFRDQIAPLLRAIPRADLLNVRDSGHIPFIEQPEQTMELLERAGVLD